jgi:hypothetical protein
MSKESYARGFAKVAHDNGVSLDALVKVAQSITGYYQGPNVSSGLAGIAKPVLRNMAKNVTVPASGISRAAKWLKKLMSTPGPTQFIPTQFMMMNAPRKTTSDRWGGYGNAQAYEDAYQAFQ